MSVCSRETVVFLPVLEMCPANPAPSVSEQASLHSHSAYPGRVPARYTTIRCAKAAPRWTRGCLVPGVPYAVELVCMLAFAGIYSSTLFLPLWRTRVRGASHPPLLCHHYPCSKPGL